MPKAVYIIRHAERIYGTEHLTASGIAQARKAGGGVSYHVVIASDIQRTQDTALLVTGKVPVIDARAGINKQSTAEEQRELLDRILGSDEDGDPLDIFKQELAQEWDNLSEEERAAILDEFPELMGGQA